jgi:hypothetical protein
MSSGGKTEKVSVTLPRELAREIRSMVPPGRVSSFFSEALEHYIAYRRQKIALAKGFGAWKVRLMLTWLHPRILLLTSVLSGQRTVSA